MATECALHRAWSQAVCHPPERMFDSGIGGVRKVMSGTGDVSQMTSYCGWSSGRSICADIEHCPFWSISPRLIDRCVGHTTDVAASGGAVTYRLHGERNQHNYDRNREPHSDDLERPGPDQAGTQIRTVDTTWHQRRRQLWREPFREHSTGGPTNTGKRREQMELTALCFRRSRSRNGADCHVSDPPRSIRGVLERPLSEHGRCGGGSDLTPGIRCRRTAAESRSGG